MNAAEDGSGNIGDSLRRLNARMEALVHKIDTLTEALEDKGAMNSTNSEEKEPGL